MATDEELLAKVREHLKGMRGIKEKPMIGGVSFMWWTGSTAPSNL